MKRGYEFGFAWFFTIIIGATIIFLAIYAATQIAKTKQFERESISGKKIGVLLTPVETNLEEGKFATLYVQEETRIFNTCDFPTNSNTFGSQGISVSVKESFSDEWQDLSGVESTFHNKYMFSGKTLTGEEEFYVLSKPFVMPFKIADLLMVWSDKERYCFYKPGMPTDILNELELLDMTNVQTVSNTDDCQPETTQVVCFSGGAQCDVKVFLELARNGGRVEKNGQTLYFVESVGSDKFGMMYSAIFSDAEIYNCQVSRLMAHASQISQTYRKNLDYLKSVSAIGSPSSSSLDAPLDSYISVTNTIKEDPSKLSTIFSSAVELNNKNRGLSNAKLF